MDGLGHVVTGQSGGAVGCDAATDAEIIERSLRAPDSFGEIFDRHHGEILRYAHARLGPDLAEDVVADTFLAAFGKRARYDQARGDARPWLYGIATREIRRYRRAEQRYQRALWRIHAEAVADDPGDRWAERATAERLRPRLAAVLSGLPQRDRDLLLLIAWADLTYDESAQALGIPIGTVRSRLNRIRGKARTALGGINPCGEPPSLARADQETNHG
jgi:RNA polymerase sigma factor (sigma-70 family)